MSRTSKKALGVLMVFTTTIGFLLSIFILFEFWHYRQAVTDKIQSGLEKYSAILNTTDAGLGVLDQVVKNVYTSTLYVNEATIALTQTVETGNQFIDSASIFLGNNLVPTITNTQTALDSAKASAVVIDNVLSALSSVPLIGINYNPPTPLNIALGEVSASLTPIQGSLINLQTNLKSTASNLQAFNDQVSILSKNIKAINQNLGQAETTISEYRIQVKSLELSAERAKTSLPIWITAAILIFTIFILWIVILQVSIFLQGITYLAPDQHQQ